jgi:hypothetical protein
MRHIRNLTTLCWLSAAAILASGLACSAKDDEEAQKRTVADIRNIGTAMFSWLTDHIGAGAAGQSQVDLQKYVVISRKELEKILVPVYLQVVPEADGWGHPYEFYLDTEDLINKKYVICIRSSGRDGRFSASVYSVGDFAQNDFDQDIVWADGFFIRWPFQR